MPDSSYLLPSLVVFTLLCGLRARIDVYDAFVCGAKEGLLTLLEMAPYLCAILTATALLRQTGVMDALSNLLSPVFVYLGVPDAAAGVVLLRPLSGSAALAAVQDVIAQAGADSRAARFACVISGASETIFFTGSLYMGAAGVRRGRAAVAAALAAYAAGVLCAALCV
ncbi:MAG: spore maturation protein [Clostridiales bacterium]|nr:spore maturation protein [Clostridiales bacterium]